LLQLSGARILAGFDHQGKFPWLDVALEWDEDVPLRRKHAHVAADLNMLVEMIVARSEPQQPTLQASKSMLQLPRDAGEIFLKPLVCVHPAAGSEMRQWPLLKFSDLINRLLERGDVHVALIGGADEEAIAHEVLSRVIKRREVFDLVGHVSLDELPSLLARAVLFVGNNSGPQHIAAALGTPTVGIHSGVVDAREWGPAGSRAVAVRRHMSCSPCFIEHSKACPRALACLTEIDSADVYRVCVRFLALKTGYNVPAGERRAVSVGETVKPRGRQRQLSAGGAL
jgi:ADP-heptose:LPS heptosyltransferase